MVQEARHGDKAALNAQCEPLLTVAEAHADGKESFARSIATELFSDFLSVEERFAANKEATEQEVIDSLRQVGTQLHALALRKGSGKLLRSLLPRWRLSMASVQQGAPTPLSMRGSPGPQAVVIISGVGGVRPDTGDASMWVS